MRNLTSLPFHQHPLPQTGMKMSELPMEMTTRIFKNLPNTSLGRIPTVCREWNSSALTDPSLWSDINLDPQGTESTLRHPLSKIVLVFMERSDRSLESVKIRNLEGRTFDAIIIPDILLLSKSSIKTIHLETYNAKPLTFFMTFPNLEDLNLVGKWRSTRIEEESLPGVLPSLAIPDFPKPPVLTEKELKWISNLKHLKFEHLYEFQSKSNERTTKTQERTIIPQIRTSQRTH